MIGTQVGTYEIRDEIGTGGMATVYRAYQPNMDRYVAVKVIKGAILGDGAVKDRFQREARLIARLEHPHLLPVYDFDGDHEPPFIVMRFLEGGTLKQVMQRGTLPPSEMIYMLRQVASALDYAHRQGIVHRDLKPTNIMIDREGNAFVADFGIARAEDGGENLTQTGMLIGTPGYMAPEQAQSTGEVDQRADLYALGAVIFEMLAGRPPYEHESNLKILMAHVQEPIPNICEINPELPRDVDGVMRTALAKDPEDRYPTAGTLVNALAAALQVDASSTPLELKSMTESISLDQLDALRAATQESPVTPETPTDQQRQMTAVYLDVTELSEMLYEAGRETETVRGIMDDLWDRFRKIAQKHGGVMQSRTDEVGVVLWGMERAREDDAEEAIRAALEMRDTQGDETKRLFGESWAPDEDSPLPFLAGITTGPVLMEREGDTGSFHASGATITLAGRLKDAAPGGGILVDHDTWTQVRGVFTFQEHPAIRVRGRKEMLEVYLAVRARPRSFRIQARGIEGVETKMIGREIELRLLQEALTLTVEDGETQVVTVVGEAGVGKSRLLFEFTNWIDLLEETLWFFQARATQPSMLQPYSLTRDLFSFRFQILDSDTLETVHDKFVKGVAGFMGEGTEGKARMIGQLVGFDFSSYPEVSAALQDPERFQKEALNHLGQFFITASRSHPIFIQIEDIHWADDRSLDLINNLVRENTQLPLFVICMARPSLFERRPQWGEGQRFHAKVNLEALSLLSSRRLVKELLKKVAEVPTQLRDLVIDRAEGNPFYIEEMIKALIDDGVIVKGEEEWTIDTTRMSAVRIPPTLTGVLQSRLDTLPAGLQQLLQRASVVGRVFWDAAMVHLSEPDGVTAGTVSSMLIELRQREMILLREESGFADTGEYVFRHAILRDVTYQTVVPRLRRTYHKRVGDWLQEVGGERSDELTLLVAEHYEKAGESVLAAERFRVAAVTARRLGAFEESMQALKKATDLLAGEEHGSRRLAMQMEVADVYAVRGAYSDARTHLESVLEEAEKLGDRVHQAKALAHLGRVCGIWLGDIEAARSYLSKGLPLAREVDDRPALMFILRQMGNLLMHGKAEGENPAAYFEESIELARELGDYTNMALAMNSLANYEAVVGDDEGALAHYEEALVHLTEQGERYGMAMVILNIGSAQLKHKNYEEVHRRIEEAAPLVHELDNDDMSSYYALVRGELLIREGDLDAARDSVIEAMKRARSAKNPRSVVDSVTIYSLWAARRGDPERATRWLGLARIHPASDVETLKTVERLLPDARGDLSEEQVQAALERGKALDLDAVVDEILEGKSSPTAG